MCPPRRSAVSPWCMNRDRNKRIRRLGEEPVHKDKLIYCVTCPYRGQRGYCSGGAVLTASTADYARFLQMLSNGGQ